MFDILHDSGKPLCLVGKGFLSQQLLDTLSTDQRDVIAISLEELQTWKQDQSQRYQYLVPTSDVKFKKKCVEFLDSIAADFFSVVGKNNIINCKVSIGKNCFINSYNDLLPDTIVINDHSVITCYCQIGHNVTIDEYCHISAYSYLNHVHLGSGTVVGVRTSILGDDFKHIAGYTNLMANSSVSKSIQVAGTYYGNRRINDETSVSHRIL